MDRYNKLINIRQSSTRTHTLTHCTYSIWWLVLGWATTKEDHPRLRIAYTSYTYGALSSSTYLLTYLLNLCILRCVTNSDKSIELASISPFCEYSFRNRTVQSLYLPSAGSEVLPTSCLWNANHQSKSFASHSQHQKAFVAAGYYGHN